MPLRFVNAFGFGKSGQLEMVGAGSTPTGPGLLAAAGAAAASTSLFPASASATAPMAVQALRCREGGGTPLAILGKAQLLAIRRGFK